MGDCQATIQLRLPSLAGFRGPGLSENDASKSHRVGLQEEPLLRYFAGDCLGSLA